MAGYLKDVRGFEKTVKQLLGEATQELGKGNEHVVRLQKRLKIVQDEIAEVAAEVQETV